MSKFKIQTKIYNHIQICRIMSYKFKQSRWMKFCEPHHSPSPFPWAFPLSFFFKKKILCFSFEWSIRLWRESSSSIGLLHSIHLVIWRLTSRHHSLQENRKRHKIWPRLPLLQPTIIFSLCYKSRSINLNTFSLKNWFFFNV